MTVKMILAVDQGNSIGWADGTLPWKIAPDMERFKNLTMGHDVFMGRKTFESLRRPAGLPNRGNIVLTSKAIPEVVTTDSMDWIAEYVKRNPEKTLWVMGGAQVYAQAIEAKLVDEIYLTLVHTLSGGDVRLPMEMYDWRYFQLAQQQLGPVWKQVEIKKPGIPLGCPPITFLTLRKQK